jgi:hypothetical protein
VFIGDQKNAENLELLKATGITHVLNCIGLSCKNHFSDHFEYLQLCLVDDDNQEIQTILYEVFDFIEECRRVGGKCLVHCHKGISRSTVIVIAYIMYTENKDFNEAYNFVKLKRGVAHPNIGFMVQMIKWRKRYKEENIDNRLHLYRFFLKNGTVQTTFIDSPKVSSLDPRTAFLTVTANKLYVWVGNLCRGQWLDALLNSASAVVARLQKYENAPNSIAILFQAKKDWGIDIVDAAVKNDLEEVAYRLFENPLCVDTCGEFNNNKHPFPDSSSVLPSASFVCAIGQPTAVSPTLHITGRGLEEPPSLRLGASACGRSFTALNWAIYHNNIDMIDVLLAYKARVDFAAISQASASSKAVELAITEARDMDWKHLPRAQLSSEKKYLLDRLVLDAAAKLSLSSKTGKGPV